MSFEGKQHTHGGKQPQDEALEAFRFHLIICSYQGALVGQSGLEPPTSRLSGVRSNRLSY